MFKGLGAMGDMAKMMKAARNAGQNGPNARRHAQHFGDWRSRRRFGQSDLHAKGELKSLDIDPSIFSKDDKEVVEDLIVAAVKDAQEKAAQRAQEEMQKMTQSGPAGGHEPALLIMAQNRDIDHLIDLMAKLPGLGPRSARRAVLHLIRKRGAYLDPLADPNAARGQIPRANV
jgi:DNA-binding protein YbaB